MVRRRREMIKGKLQDEEKHEVAAQYDENNGRALGLSPDSIAGSRRIRRHEGGCDVPDDQ